MKKQSNIRIWSGAAFLVAMFGFMLVGLYKEKYRSVSIFEAANSGDVVMLEKLLKSDPDAVNKKDKTGKTPLCVAVRRRHKKAAEFLLAHGATVDGAMECLTSRFFWGTLPPNGPTELPVHVQHAIREDEEIVELLRQHGATE